MSDLENITREDAEAFFKKYYKPSNLISVVVGDVDTKHVLALAAKYLEPIPSGPKPAPLRTIEPPQTGERRVTLRLQSQRVYVAGFHKPDVNDPDDAVYDAISSVLSDGRSSRLYRSLVKDKKIATQVGGFPGFPGQKYPGLFLFFAFAAPGHNNDEIEKAIDAEIEKLRNEPVSAEELDGVKRRTRAGILQQLDEQSPAMADLLASYQQLTGDWRHLFQANRQDQRRHSRGHPAGRQGDVHLRQSHRRCHRAARDGRGEIEENHDAETQNLPILCDRNGACRWSGVRAAARGACETGPARGGEKEAGSHSRGRLQEPEISAAEQNQGA